MSTFSFDHGSFGLTVTYDDPSGMLDGFGVLPAAINAAVAYIATKVVLRGTLDIVVSTGATGTGRLNASPLDVIMTGQSFEGRGIAAFAVVEEARSGIDANPDIADIRITLPDDPDYFARYWFDPRSAGDISAKVPMSRIDLFSALVHELLHGMGIAGYRDVATGDADEMFMSVFDTLVDIDGGDAYFTGAAAMAVHGGPVALELGGSQGVYHLGDGHEDDIMNGTRFAMGERYRIDDLDLAILADIGWELQPSAHGPQVWLAEQDGAVVHVGGEGTVIGSGGVQQVFVDDAAGTIRFDPSFNRGGDTITLFGAASAWTAAVQGSSVIFSDGDTHAIVPVGTAGTTIVFGDGTTGSLAFAPDAGAVLLGDHALGTLASRVEMLPPAGSFAIIAPESGPASLVGEWFAPSGGMMIG